MVMDISRAETLQGEGFTLRRMISPVTMAAKNLMSFVATVDPNGEIPEHEHGPAELALHFLEGKASVTIDGEERELGPDQAVFVPAGSGIGLRNTGQEALKFIAVLSPPIDVSVCATCGIEIGSSQP